MSHSQAARPDRTALGIGIILASVLTMAFADAIVKLVSADITIWQVFVARSLVAAGHGGPGPPVILGGGSRKRVACNPHPDFSTMRPAGAPLEMTFRGFGIQQVRY